MLIILLSFVLGGLFLLLSYLFEDYWDMSVLSVLSFIFAFVLLVIFGSTGFISICKNIDITADTIELNEEYKSLVYQLDNIDTLYVNSRANSTKQLFDQITKWNTTIASNQSRHESLWTNWLYPIDYSQFKLIELS